MCHTTLCISTYFFPHNHGSVSSSTSAQQSQLRREGFANRTLGKERTIFRCSNGSLLVNRNIRSAELDMAEESVVIPPWPMDGKGDSPTPTPSYICLLPWLMAVFFLFVFLSQSWTWSIGCQEFERSEKHHELVSQRWNFSKFIPFFFLNLDSMPQPRAPNFARIGAWRNMELLHPGNMYPPLLMSCSIL